MERIPKSIWVLAFGGLLILPQLGSFGLWDPSEIRHADVAMEVAQQGTLLDITVGGKHPAGPVLPVWLTAGALGLLGSSELAARLPFALFGLLGLLLAFYLGRRLVDEWAGLAAAFVLGTTPTYLFQARQLGGDIVFYVALLAAAGGLAAYLLPADGERRRADLAVGALGLVAGALSRGILLGWLLPLLLVGLALLAWSRTATAAGRPRRSAAGEALIAVWPSLWPVLLATAGVLVLALVYLHVPVGLRKVAEDGTGVLVWPRKGAWLVLGGLWRPVTAPPTFEQPLRDLAFACYPWFALLPLMLGSLVWPRTEAPSQPSSQDDPRAAERFAQLLVGMAFVLGYLASVAAGVFFGGAHFPVLPLLAFGMGLWLRREGSLWRQSEVYWPFGALVAVGLLLALQQDFYAKPETLAFSHLLDKVTFPVKLDVRWFVRAFGFGLAALLFIALSGFGAAVGRGAVRGASRWQTARVLIGKLMAALVTWSRPASLVVIAVFAAWCVHWLTPQLSLHMSNKALYQTYHRCRGDSEGLLGQYQAKGRGAAYYTDGKVEQIGSQAQLFARLKQPERFFAVIPASQLGTIDQAARRQRLKYYVLDARSSKFLIISNKLQGACNEEKNPLREMVSDKPPPRIAKRLEANFENKVKLIGYDCPDVVRSGGSFEIKLYFEVVGKLPSNYKIFLHFDKPASRFHGDHTPLGEMYPTQYWLPGDYIVDTHEVELPLLTTSPGLCTIYAGFWLGSKRLKVVEGPNDGVNRVRLGRMRIRVY